MGVKKKTASRPEKDAGGGLFPYGGKTEFSFERNETSVGPKVEPGGKEHLGGGDQGEDQTRPKKRVNTQLAGQ